MYLSHVEVEGFRNFKHLVISPFPRRAVLVGENGVGKSNLLMALRLVLDPSLPDTKRILRPEDICEDNLRQLRDGASVRVMIEISDFDSDPVAKAVLDGCIVSTDPYRARLTYLFKPRLLKAGVGQDENDESKVLTVDDYDFVVFGGEDEKCDARGVRRLVSLAVLPALRDAVSDLSSIQRSPLTELLEHLPPDAAKLQEVASEIDSVTSKLTSDANLNELESRIRTQVGRLAGPQLNVAPTLGLSPSQADQLLRNLRLFVDQARIRGVGDTSTGSANVIYLALLLERLNARREAERNVATILGVEEPEAHLHPGLQRHLFSYLLRHGPNILLTTHSPNIVAVAPLESIVLLHSSDGNGTTARTAAGVSDTPAMTRDLERYLDVTRAEAVFARFIIFVEGIAELYLIPALARVAGFDLDAWGVVVTSVESTNFAPYRRMVSAEGLSVPSVVVTDGDPAKGRRYLGLKRSISLLAPDSREIFKQGILELQESAADNKKEELLATAWAEEVYVGRETLEIDLIPVLSTEIKAAFAELSRSAGNINKFNAAVDRIATGAIDAKDLEMVMSKIDNFGKGRFAQRLASHVDAMSPDELLSRYSAIFPAGINESNPAAALYLFAALAFASRSTRGTGLFT